MATEGYEVVNVEELTVLRTTSSLPQADGSTIHQNGMGRTYLEGEVIPADQVAEDWKEALDSGEGALYEALSKVLQPSSGDSSDESVAARLGLPFEGYSDMEAGDIVGAMRHLPSATVQRIKAYEASRDDPRTEIVDYNIGFGEHPDDRQNTEVEVPETDETKAVRALTTREVPEDGPVQHGEGITGTGEPQVPHGAKKAEEESGGASGRKRGGNIAGARRGRRERAKPAESPPSSE